MCKAGQRKAIQQNAPANTSKLLFTHYCASAFLEGQFCSDMERQRKHCKNVSFSLETMPHLHSLHNQNLEFGSCPLKTLFSLGLAA